MVVLSTRPGSDFSLMKVINALLGGDAFVRAQASNPGTTDTRVPTRF
jgi:hypothetical protein